MAMCTGCQQTADLERCHGNVRWRIDVNVYSTLHSVLVLQSWGIAIVTCIEIGCPRVQYPLFFIITAALERWQHALKT